MLWESRPEIAAIIRPRRDTSRTARSGLLEATQIFEQLGVHSGAAWSLSQQGDIARELGDLDEARLLYERALSAFREAGDRWGNARSLADLGSIAGQKGDHAAAYAAYRESLEIFKALGYRRGVARVIAAAAVRLRQLIGAPLPPAEQSKFDESLRPAWESLSETESQNAWTQGGEMTPEAAVEYGWEQAR